MRPSTAVSKLAERLSWLVAAILVLLPFHAILTTWAGSNFGHLDLWRIWKEIVILIMMPPVFWLAWRTPGLKKWLIRSWIPRLFGIYILLYLVLGAWALTHNQVNATALIYAFIVNLRFIGFSSFAPLSPQKRFLAAQLAETTFYSSRDCNCFWPTAKGGTAQRLFKSLRLRQRHNTILPNGRC